MASKAGQQESPGIVKTGFLNAKQFATDRLNEIRNVVQSQLTTSIIKSKSTNKSIESINK